MNFEMASERLLFTKLDASDWELFRSIYTNPALLQHIQAPRSEEEIRNQFEKELTPWSPASSHWLTWTIREQASHQHVGVMGICSRDGEQPTAEVGFILLDTSAGKGYATEGLKQVIKFATDTFGFEKFTALCSEEHTASRNVLEKAGMTLDEILPENSEINGQLINDCFYSMMVGEK
ncbi:GNAT family N-acetyltransferase [Tumebacillus avium]|uniref:GNAT family N-acetyltransferase n=1 Tax=Tumebacillus avium TaxID=1903704 RepID=A0A1Y0ILT6_9BACL|nr:GNAT family N-acetyltransferase [Tumebacillus avium]ARU60786.1 GNAT family N-acetyltransferase [Tumebacillus avium]